MYKVEYVLYMCMCVGYMCVYICMYVIRGGEYV